MTGPDGSTTPDALDWSSFLALEFPRAINVVYRLLCIKRNISLASGELKGQKRSCRNEIRGETHDI